MLDYAALAALAAVVREGSFERAALALHVTPSAVSQRIKALEEKVGAVLVRRGQPAEATPQGRALCRHFDAVCALEGELAADLPGLSLEGEGRATIPVAVNADSLDSWFLAAVADFSRKTGHLVEIKVDDQDHTAEWLRRGEVLAAVTSEEKPVQGCRVRPLGALRYRATASPDFMTRHFPAGVTPEALALGPALAFNRKDRLQSQWMERHFGRDLSPPLNWVPSPQGFVIACRLGLGWGCNPDMLVVDDLAKGRLVELVPDATLDIPLFWQVSRLPSGLLKSLGEAVAVAAAECLCP
ncbi:MAG TPA: LysR family transcriptional regulator ArgP [Ensifer sp.]|nr:LysR family transcriptional regulator ArgP [Ensifer sp.]